MSKEQLVSRLLSSLASVNSKKLLTGRLTDDEWKRIAYAAGMLSNSGLLIDDNSMLTVSDINAECRRVQNLGLVIIDYLQLMSTASGSNAESRQQTVSEMSRMLKIMAKELNVPVICCCQLSRASAQRTEKRPILSDLRESGSLEQDADIVLGLYREDYFNREAESHNVAECIVMKNRHGNTGTIKLLWEPEFTRFQALDTTHEEESY
jgi:replicative DNA helicase